MGDDVRRIAASGGSTCAPNGRPRLITATRQLDSSEAAVRIPSNPRDESLTPFHFISPSRQDLILEILRTGDSIHRTQASSVVRLLDLETVPRPPETHRLRDFSRPN